MRRKHIDLRAVLSEAVAAGAGEDPVAGLVTLVAALRPRTDAAGEARVVALCDRLAAGPAAIREGLGALIRRVLGEVHSVHALTESGVPSDNGFLDELLAKIGHHLLPEPEDTEDLRSVLRRVFPKARDHRWLASVSPDVWRRLLDLLGLNAESVVKVPDELARAVEVLAHHVASLGLSPAITNRMPELDRLDSPFLRLSSQVLRYIESFDNAVAGDEEPLLDAALETLRACRTAVETLRANKHRFGTSLRLTNLSFRLLRQIDRLEALLHLTEPVQRDFQTAASRLLVALVEAENIRNHIGRHVRESADLLAYQVVERAANKGLKYITTTAREYARFFLASLGGGFIVAIFALFKVLLADGPMSLAAEALLYSLNYSACFIAIYLTGAALATKQPAMTASTVARSMDGPGGSHQLDQLAELIVCVWRSQFVSFVGNLAAAFPTALLLSELFEVGVGAPPASAIKATKLLADVHPWASGALFYAAVAGVFLFMAGIFSGWVDNRNLYRAVPQRVSKLRWLNRLAGPDRAARVARFIDNHSGVLLGNLMLGFCLGCAGTLGVILGLPFDIRHIAFSSANIGFALEGLDYAVPASVIGPAVIGVALIGFVNFVVSFGLTLSMALESRSITLRENRAVLGLLLRRLLRQPWQYFIPPRATPPQ